MQATRCVQGRWAGESTSRAHQDAPLILTAAESISGDLSCISDSIMNSACDLLATRVLLPHFQNEITIVLFYSLGFHEE